MKFLRMFALSMVALMLVGTTLFAQGVGGQSGTLTGQVLDENNAPLPGVLVTVSGAAGTKTVTTDADGKFLFPYLNPGTYDVRAELASYTTIEQSGITIRLGQRAELTFKMRLGTEEVLVVTGEAPVVDVSSTTTGANISSELVRDIPVGRGFANLVALAPGVVDSGVAGANVSISGGSGLDNQYLVDGVNITDAGFGSIGAYSGTFGSLGSGFPTDFVKETQVKSGGFEPEYGQAIGGIVNVVTQSGGNKFTGNAYINFQPDALEGDIELVNLDESLVANLEDEQSIDGGGNVSGPIVKDRLFFFGAYNPRKTEITILNDPEADSFGAFPSFRRERTVNAYAFKATGNATSNHSFEFSAFGDPSKGAFGLQRAQSITSATPIGSFEELEFGSNNQAVRYNGILGSNFFVEAQYSHTKNRFEEILGEDAGGYLYRIRSVDANGVEQRFNTGGIGIFEQELITDNDQYTVKLTNTWRGHEFRYGFAYEDIFYGGGVGYSGATYTAFNGQPTTTGAIITQEDCVDGSDANGDPFPASFCAAHPILFTPLRNRLSPTPVPTGTDYFDWFVQDSWNVTDYLNVKAGVRWEKQGIRGQVEGSQDIEFSDNWGPRLGASYDYLKNGKSKIYGSYGKFYEKIPNDLAIRALVQELTTTAYYYDPLLTQYVPGTGGVLGGYLTDIEGKSTSDVLGRQAQGEISGYEASAQFSEEFLVGVEQEVAKNLSLGARYIHRTVGNVLEDVQVDFARPETDETGFREQPVMAAEDFVDHCLFQGQCAYFITNMDGHMPGLPEFTRKYDAVEFTFEKRLSEGWQFLGSYRWSQLEGNYEGLFQRSNGQDDPNITTLGDFADTPFMAFTLRDGPLPNDRPHDFKFFGSKLWDFGLTTGVGVNVSSGRPLTERGNVPLYGTNTRELTEKGGLGRLDTISTLDVHLAYGWNLGTDQRLEFGFDVFNLFNQQNATDIVESSEQSTSLSYDAPPDLDFLNPLTYQDPRRFRFFARIGF